MFGLDSRGNYQKKEEVWREDYLRPYRKGKRKHAVNNGWESDFIPIPISCTMLIALAKHRFYLKANHLLRGHYQHFTIQDKLVCCLLTPLPRVNGSSSGQHNRWFRWIDSSAIDQSRAREGKRVPPCKHNAVSQYSSNMRYCQKSRIIATIIVDKSKLRSQVYRTWIVTMCCIVSQALDDSFPSVSLSTGMAQIITFQWCPD